MNNKEVLKSIASKLYVEAVDKCLLTSVIAVAAIKGISNQLKREEQAEKEYVSAKILHSLANVTANKAS